MTMLKRPRGRILASELYQDDGKIPFPRPPLRRAKPKSCIKSFPKKQDEGNKSTGIVPQPLYYLRKRKAGKDGRECDAKTFAAPRHEISREHRKVPIRDAEVKKMVECAERKNKISYSDQLETKCFAKKIEEVIQSLPFKSILKKLKLRNCSVDSEFLKTVSEAVRLTKLSASILDLSGNNGLDLTAVKALRSELGSKVLDLSNTELGEKEIGELGEIEQLKGLRLNYIAFEYDFIVTALVKLINNGLEELSLVDSRISGDQLEKISERLNEKVPLKVLDLCHVTLTIRGARAVTRIVNKTDGMERLVLSDCTLSGRLLQVFEDDVNQKISELDLSSNHQITEGNMGEVSRLTEKVGCELLDLSNNSMDGTQVRQLLESEVPKQVRRLSLSENPSIDATAVGELTEKWKLSSLDISHCRLNPKQILALAESIRRHKLCRIDVNDPTATVTEKRREALGFLSKKTGTLEPSL